jgi:hypothetical protein
MAEFVDVLRQFDRMCKENAGCFNCPLHEPDGVSDRCSIGAFVNDSERIEREVMKWAKEHPEPVYPTWREWLIKLGIVSFEPDFRVLLDASPTTLANTVKAYINEEGSKPIPVDIAEKLGIEPKE